MEVAFGIIFWVVVIGFFILRRLYRNGAFDSAPASIPALGTKGLQARTRWVEDSEDPDLSHFAVEIRGEVAVPGGYKILFRTELDDVTEAANQMPIVALLEGQQAANSVAFLHVQEMGDPPRGGGVLNLSDWTWVEKLWPVMLRAPHSGRRKIAASLQLLSANGSTLWEDRLIFDAELPVVGYVEAGEREKIDDKLVVRLGVAVASASGGLDDREMAVIRDWSQARIGYLDEDDPERAERADALNAALRDAVAASQEGQLSVGDTLAKLKTDGSESGRFEAAELVFAVAAADSEIDPSELTLVNQICERLDIDQKFVHDTRDKLVGAMTFEAGADCASLLGIDSAAPREEIRQALNEQYERWSSRAVSQADEDKRREAEQMLEAIAECRAKLLT